MCSLVLVLAFWKLHICFHVLWCHAMLCCVCRLFKFLIFIGDLFHIEFWNSYDFVCFIFVYLCRSVFYCLWSFSTCTLARKCASNIYICDGVVTTQLLKLGLTFMLSQYVAGKHNTELFIYSLHPNMCQTRCYSR